VSDVLNILYIQYMNIFLYKWSKILSIPYLEPVFRRLRDVFSRARIRFRKTFISDPGSNGTYNEKRDEKWVLIVKKIAARILMILFFHCNGNCQTQPRLKGQSHEIFDPLFFHEWIPLGSMMNGSKYVCIWLRIRKKLANICWLRAMPHSAESQLCAMPYIARSRDFPLCSLALSQLPLCRIARSRPENFRLEFHTKWHSA
jgi:hypothetical protein